MLDTEPSGIPWKSRLFQKRRFGHTIWSFWANEIPKWGFGFLAVPKMETKIIWLWGGCHAWRIPAIERTHAKITIPEALKYVF